MVVETLNDICFQQEHENTITRFHCRVSADFYGFRGHFDGRPILPGVCQLKLVSEGISLLSAPPSIARVEKMKFHNLIVPDTAFIIELEPQTDAWRYRIFSDTADYASGKIVLR
jgi:3-hydroxyacyl-[acyl-carrier-protein] dehydratase